MVKAGAITDAKDKATLLKLRSELSNADRLHPDVGEDRRRVALGLGTMIGWKRIVVTVGEKIGKSHLTYAQGASAEMVAMATIGAADVSACRSARRTSCRPASPARWRPTARGCRRRRCATSCSPGS